jgi:hypothetical protein
MAIAAQYRNGLAKKALLFCVVLLLIGMQVADARPDKRRRRGTDKAYRSMTTDTYQMVIQRDGYADAILRDDTVVFDNGQPMIRFAGEARLQPLRPQASQSSRVQVNDALGSGQGMVLAGKNMEWHLRTYPNKPFFTVQVIYVNNSKGPVRVAELIPWAAQESCQLAGAQDSTWLLGNGSLFSTGSDFAQTAQDALLSQWNITLHNTRSGKSIVGGFLSAKSAYTQVRVGEPSGTANTRFNLFQGECIYDPPITVPSGGRLASELFYLDVTESQVHWALERFGKAVAVINGVRNARPFIPHGWDSWSTRYGRDINEGLMRNNLDVVDRELKRYGWTNFSIDAGWSAGDASWKAHPGRFPAGMKAMADDIHGRAMTAGLWMDPFTVPRNAPLAKEHPEWMVEPNEQGKTIMGPDKLILDVTAPGAAEHVRASAAMLSQEWKFDAMVEADFVYHLMLAEGYHDTTKTRVEIMHLGMKALREGLGKDAFLMAVTPQMITGIHAQGMRVGVDCAPLWKAITPEGPWGAVDSLTNAIRRYYLSPHLFVPDQDVVFFGHEASRKRWKVENQPKLTWSQSLAWLTGAALTGGAVKIGEPFTELKPREIKALRKVLPSLERPARPIDLFQQGPPRIWSLPVKGRAGDWHIVALFNWRPDAADTLAFDFEQLGLQENAYYTVYDFWNEKYYGTAEKELSVRVPPGSVLLLGLRKYQIRPMFLATDRHFTQGALDHKEIQWDDNAKVLRGNFDGIAQTSYTLRILAHEPFVMKSALVSTGAVETIQDDSVILLRFQSAQNGPIDWEVAF